MSLPKGLAGAFGAIVLSVGLVAGLTVPAEADPDAVKKAQQQLMQIEQQSSEIDARYSALQGQLDTANAKLAQLQADVRTQTAKVGTSRAALSQLALANYQAQGIDITAQLLTSTDDAAFMSRLTTLQAVSGRTNEQLQALQADQATLTSLTTAAAQQRDAVATAKAKQGQLAAEYAAKQKQAEAVLAKLTAEEKARLAAAQAAEAKARAAQIAAQTSRSQGGRPSTSPSSSSTKSPSSQSSTPTSDPAPVPASGRAATAVAFARAQVGKAYVMGATGPSAYDCSGLTMSAWRAAGVSIPRTSQAQFGAGVSVPISQLQPGDLVFYYSGISHVGIYIGNGMIVDAANPRKGVRIISVSSMPIAGARRVG